MNTLLHWIDGKPVEPESGEYRDVLEPLTDAVIARVASGSRDDVDLAVKAASRTFASYQKTLPKEREAWLLRAAASLETRADDWVDVLIDETGSPIAKARREVQTAVGVLRAAAGSVRRLIGHTHPSDIPDRLSYSVRQPLGVVAGITPFNVPLIKGIKHSAMPLATGNTVVLLPSLEAPSVAQRIATLYHESGFPSGAFNVVQGDGYDIGDALTGHPDVRFVGFTGSTSVGKRIAEQCGRQTKRYTLEMGGKNPLILFEDADLDRAIGAATVGSFLFQGQICMSSSRILVHRSRYETLVKRLVIAARELKMGDLRDPATVIGPIINERQRQRIRRHLADAIAKGARLRTGGNWHQNRCEPTILTDVPENAMMCDEETFGPVASIRPFDSFQDAVDLANDTRFGLTASVFTANLDIALRCARQIQAGMVHINESTVQEEAHVPFGGMGDSGFGREGSEASVESLTQWKWITLASTS